MCAYTHADWRSWTEGRGGGPYLCTPQILHSLRLPDLPPVKPANMPGFISTVLNKVCVMIPVILLMVLHFVCVVCCMCHSQDKNTHYICRVGTFWVCEDILAGPYNFVGWLKARKLWQESAFYQQVLTKIEVQICVLRLFVHLSTSGWDSGCFITPHFNWQIQKLQVCVC